MQLQILDLKYIRRNKYVGQSNASQEMEPTYRNHCIDKKQQIVRKRLLQMYQIDTNKYDLQNKFNPPSI